jgi:hypothetical protein
MSKARTEHKRSVGLQHGDQGIRVTFYRRVVDGAGKAHWSEWSAWRHPYDNWLAKVMNWLETCDPRRVWLYDDGWLVDL